MTFPDELRAALPVQSDRFMLELPMDWTDERSGEVHEYVRETAGGDWLATLRTITWELTGDQRSIRDVKEQEVVVLHARHRDDPRVSAYIAGWAAALQHVLSVHAELAEAHDLPRPVAERLECCMPHDLCFPDVLDLRRPRTDADFTDALLTGSRRLGALLP